MRCSPLHQRSGASLLAAVRAACPPAENFLSANLARGVAQAEMRKLIAPFLPHACIRTRCQQHALHTVSELGRTRCCKHFSPAARHLLTTGSRQKSDTATVASRSTMWRACPGECVVVEHRQRRGLRSPAVAGRLRADRQDARHRQTGPARRHRRAGKKMAAPTSGHPDLRLARRGQCASSSSSSAYSSGDNRSLSSSLSSSSTTKIQPSP